MLTSERKALLLNELRQDGRIIAKEVSQRLGLSEDTIRRDLRELATEGLLQRVHGGALPASSAVADFGVRQSMGQSAKECLGRAGARLIQPGQIVFIDGGTTNVQLVRQLPRELKTTIVTHSPSIAVELSGYTNVEIELIGGRVFKHSIVTVGARRAEAISRIRADLYFMGATGLHPDTGVTTGDAEEAAMKRLICGQSAETVVLATTEKLGAASAYGVVPLGDINSIIVELGVPVETLDPFRKLGLTIVEA